MTEEQKIFIECYSFKQMCFKDIELELKKFDISKKYSDVQRLNKECKNERIKIQKIRNKFTKERKKDNKNFKEFYLWYIQEESKNVCGYCGISQDELYTIFSTALPLNDKAKRASGTLEIERKDSKNNSYHVSNLILACPLCNNAKSNLIDENSWTDLFASPMKEYYKKILGK